MKLVLIRNPHLINPYFWDLIELRKYCYSPVNGYPESFFPLSQIDFYSNQYLIYEEEKLIAAYRCFNTCKKHKGPLIKMAKTWGTNRVKKKISDLIEETPLLSYQSQFVIRPELSKSEISGKVKEIITAINWYEHLNNGLRSVIGASVKKFKTERIFRAWGYPPLEDDQGVLGYFEKPESDQEIQLVFGSPSLETKRSFEKHREVFKRIEILSDKDDLKAA